RTADDRRRECGPPHRLVLHAGGELRRAARTRSATSRKRRPRTPRAMTFLEARQIASTFQRGHPLPFLLAMSGTADPLDLFVPAAAAKARRAAAVRALPVNPLGAR